MAIKALMVDVDGVLVHGRPEDGLHWSTSLLEDLGLHPNDLHREFFAVHWEDVVIGRAILQDSLARVLDRIAPRLTAGQLIAYWLERDSRLNRQFLQELDTIRAKGMRVHLATNQEHRRAQYLMDSLGLANHVDGIQYSAGLGARKPFREFFDQAALRVDLHPNELLLVDDSTENVKGAEAAGWKAAHWTGGQSLIEIVEHKSQH
ncbi:MAG: HAD-IA family hydrolase [Bryobacteraceae bacterium]|nr:HAD-IA family hydrolase [Bryobacteraceae bacterium]